jgi:hypothetical protein
MKSVAFTLGAIFALYTPSSGAAPVCIFGTVPCFLACSNPPRLTDADQAVHQLRKTQYETLNWVDESTALLTTQLAKCMGINGWKRYRFRVWAVGIVVQAATSWDGLRTVDLALESFNGNSLEELLPQKGYVRAEVVRRVWKRLEHPPSRGDIIRVEGELHWDGHGFLEIHPSQISDVRFLSTQSLPPNSQNDHGFLPRL